MARKKITPTVFEQFINFIRLNDAPEFVGRPKEWILYHSKALKFLRKLRSDRKNSSYWLMASILECQKYCKHEYLTSKNEDMSRLARLKSSDMFECRVWAIAYYLNKLHLSNSFHKVYKKTVAFEIENILKSNYSFHVNKNQCNRPGSGQIPAITTIKTEWLKNI